MKIKAIVAEHTDEFQTAFRTDPVLTEDVFEEALLVQWRGQYAMTYSLQKGLLIVTRSSISKNDIEAFEVALTNAEKAVERRKGASQQERQTRLNYRATETGLPIE